MRLHYYKPDWRGNLGRYDGYYKTGKLVDLRFLAMLRGDEFDSIDYLVIGDRDLLVMADIFDLAIVTAAHFLQIRSIIDLNTAID
ncbi:hypothetical protein [Chamaesiphon minutus]|uniref:Uncharacterized protein n=1 Tax=Chamaesiphon minutus (strain ATCC 27169 / PCC 6605) TaxID=1173020 RepID=K9ULR5_CHAP6|nr:hypothetical protein [Chamaesiphon minutus]AFY95144.1 hypothetical protein Cha6605_4201 [Chamaesiphon minutus PCC 6605]